MWIFALSALTQAPDLFPVNKNGKAGYIDHTGKIVIPLKFDEAWEFSEGLAPIRIGYDWGYINVYGNVVIKPQFFQAWKFKENRARVGVYWKSRKVINNTVGNYGYIDKSGRVIKSQNTSDDEFYSGRALFQTEGNMPNSRTGYKDEKGNIVIEAKFLGGNEFSEGLACVHTEKGFGYIDTDGKTVIDFIYDHCGSFSEGLASVLVNGLVGFIDKSGKMVIQPKFAFVPGDETRFSDGVAVVKVGESEKPTKEGLRDVTITADRNILANTKGFFGVIDIAGKFIIPAKYVQLGDFNNGLALVNLSDAYIVHGDTNRWGYINKEGKIVWKSF